MKDFTPNRERVSADNGTVPPDKTIDRNSDDRPDLTAAPRISPTRGVSVRGDVSPHDPAPTPDITTAKNALVGDSACEASTRGASVCGDVFPHDPAPTSDITTAKSALVGDSDRTTPTRGVSVRGDVFPHDSTPTPDITTAKNVLVGDVTLAFSVGGSLSVSRERGVRPLLDALDRGVIGASFADRIVGRAAALLYVRLGAREVYAEVLSRPAEQVFLTHNIPYSYGKLTDMIVNRSGNGPCPMDDAVRGITDPAAAERSIRARLSALTTQQGN